MSGKISTSSRELEESEKRLSIILIVLLVAAIVICMCIHCFFRHQRRLALETNQAGESELGSRSIAESDIPLNNVSDSVIGRTAGLPGSPSAPNAISQPRGPITPAEHVCPASGPNPPAISRRAEDPEERFWVAAFPNTPRGKGITGNSHLSRLTDFAIALETPPRISNGETGISNGETDCSCVAYIPFTTIDLDDEFGPYPFPPRIASSSLRSPTDFNDEPGNSLRTNSEKRYPTIPAAAITAAWSSTHSANGSSNKRTCTMMVVGQPEPESLCSEAARLKVSGDGVVYDYTTTRIRTDRHAKETLQRRGPRAV